MNFGQQEHTRDETFLSIETEDAETLLVVRSVGHTRWRGGSDLGASESEVK